MRTCLVLNTAEASTCKQGQQECRPTGLDVTVWGDCIPLTPQTEDKQALCADGVDNDCDGKVDQADPKCSKFCVPGQVGPCYGKGTDIENTKIGKGICRTGIRFCEESGTWSACVGDVQPKAEDCNRQDDDCDGKVDNPPAGQTTLNRPCYLGKTHDDDDKGCTSKDGTYECKGLCKAGRQVCLNGIWGNCVGEVLPTLELCNGKDDDCDGQVDNFDEDDDTYKLQAPLCRKQSGGCFGLYAPKERCQNGAWLPCEDEDYKDHFSAYTAGADACDGEDNNCDGQIDENNKSCVATIAGEVDGNANGKGTNARFEEPIALAVDAAGNVLISDFENHLIRKLDVCGNVTTLAGGGAPGFADGANARFRFPTGLVVDKKGKVYIADRDNFRVRMLAPNGVSTLAGTGVKGSQDARPAQFLRPTALALDKNEVFLYVADAHLIRRIQLQTANGKSAGTVETIAGSTRGFQDDDNDARTAKFSEIWGLAFGEDGALYIADTGNNRIRKLTLPTSTTKGAVTTVAGTGEVGFQDGAALLAKFNQPLGIAFASKDLLYIADAENHRIRALDLAKGQVSVLAGSGVDGEASGALLQSEFSFPAAVALGAAGQVYVADMNNHSIRKLQLANAAAQPRQRCAVTFAGAGIIGVNNADQAHNAQFNDPQHIVFDKAGNLYISDSDNHRIRKISVDGQVTTFVGGRSGYRDGKGTGARFFSPQGLVFDAKGNLFVADEDNGLIRKVDPSGNVTTVAGIVNADPTEGVQNGPGLKSSFAEPTTLAFDASGNLYVGDGNLLRKIVPSKGMCEGKATKDPYCVSTVTGALEGGFADGALDKARFKGIKGLVFDSADNLYISDSDNHRIRKIDFKAKQVSTFAGTGTAGDTDGAKGAASFRGPSGITIYDNALYIADSDNHMIRTIDLQSNEVDTLAGTGDFSRKDGPLGQAEFQKPVGLAFDKAGNLYISDSENHVIRMISR